jgi:hypothetical protein
MMRRAKVLGAVGWFALLLGVTMIAAGGSWAAYGFTVWALALVAMLVAVIGIIRASRRHYA